MDLFAPRDARAAARALQVVLLLAAAVLGGGAAVHPPAAGGAVVVAVVLSMVVVAGLLVRVRCPGWAFGLLPVLGVAAVAVLDALTRDATTAAQVFFLLPVLFAATHLRPTGAWLVTAISVTGEAVTTLLLLPLPQALTDWAFVSVVAVTTTLLLVRVNGQRDRLLAELRRQAAVDPLTGLVTRRVLDDAAACALTSADAADGTALVVVDVDHFKGVNDTHGHPVGDALLVHLGGLLREVSGPSAVVSRLGGDELAVLLPGESLAGAARRGAAVVEVVRARPLLLDGRGGAPLPTTVSVGVAHAPSHAADLPGLYRAADAALYRAKRTGRDGVAVAGAPERESGAAVPGGAPTPAPPAQRASTPGAALAPRA
ncbi:GGDEF domain-containing protein [uncultured Pseudokineococcus sp.]|uniref:GGDEF domain-containing protein n=1 Tax=uncultured Pseudokineococcus sp. TaxID=1642928 RepID=UPI002633A94C|nr:GGDEF domain-containing protein [uncultured Pseudokineococcus sp.]